MSFIAQFREGGGWGFEQIPDLTHRIVDEFDRDQGEATKRDDGRWDVQTSSGEAVGISMNAGEAISDLRAHLTRAI